MIAPGKSPLLSHPHHPQICFPPFETRALSSLEFPKSPAHQHVPQVRQRGVVLTWLIWIACFVDMSSLLLQITETGTGKSAKSAEAKPTTLLGYFSVLAIILIVVSTKQGGDPDLLKIENFWPSPIKFVGHVWLKIPGGYYSFCRCFTGLDTHLETCFLSNVFQCQISKLNLNLKLHDCFRTSHLIRITAR